MTLRYCLFALAALGLSACAGLKHDAPLTDLTGRSCDASFVLDAASDLVINSEKPLTQKVDASARCVATSANVPAVYAPFRLPDFERAYRVTVESDITGQALFAPEILMIDAAGTVQRRIGNDRFSTRGSLLQATVFVNPENSGERYLVIASAAGAVGQVTSRVSSNVATMPIMAGAGMFMYTQGSEAQQFYTYSHNGVLRLHARAAEVAK